MKLRIRCMEYEADHELAFERRGDRLVVTASAHPDLTHERALGALGGASHPCARWASVLELVSGLDDESAGALVAQLATNPATEDVEPREWLSTALGGEVWRAELLDALGYDVAEWRWMLARDLRLRDRETLARLGAYTHDAIDALVEEFELGRLRSWAKDDTTVADLRRWTATGLSVWRVSDYRREVVDEAHWAELDACDISGSEFRAMCTALGSDAAALELVRAELSLEDYHVASDHGCASVAEARGFCDEFGGQAELACYEAAEVVELEQIRALRAVGIDGPRAVLWSRRPRAGKDPARWIARARNGDDIVAWQLGRVQTVPSTLEAL